MTSLAASLAAAIARHPGGELLSGDLSEGFDEPARDAAVLVAITDRPEPGLILTERRADLRTHAGQVAFPGGRIDEGETPTQAALREAWEEIALDPAHASIVGEVDRYTTVTGFHITPVIAVVPPDLPLVANPAEVASWFEPPLAFLLDPANQVSVASTFRGRERHYLQINWNGHRIWGATAAMIANLSRRLG